MSLAVESQSPEVAAPATPEPPMLTSGSVLLGLLLALFAYLQVSWSGGQYTACYYRMGAFYGPAFDAGEWQRAWLAGWLHLSARHWLFNLATTMLLVRSAQMVTTMSWSLLICAIGCLAASFSEWLTASDRVCLGISGGTFALIGACLVAGLVRGTRENHEEKLSAGAMGIVMLLCQIPGLFDSEVSHRAHATGLFAGCILGACLCVPAIRKVMHATGAFLIVGYLGALGYAAQTLWTHSQPWALATPEPLAELDWPLAQTIVRLEIPSTQVAGRQYETWDTGEWHLRCGFELADPVFLSLITAEVPPDSDLPLPQDEPEYARRIASPVQVTIDGHPFWYLDCVSATDEDIALPRWVGNVNGQRIDLQLSIAADANDHWRAYARRFGEHLSFHNPEPAE